MKLVYALLGLVLFSAADTTQAAQPLSAYAALPDVTGMRIAPDGHHIAVLQPVSGAPSIVVYTVGGGRCAFAPTDVKIEGVEWASSDQLWVEVSVVRTAFFHLHEYLPRKWTRALLLKSDCTNPRLVFGASFGQVSAAGGNADFLGFVPGDDKHVFVGSLGDEAIQHGYEVYKVDVATGQGELTYTTKSDVMAVHMAGTTIGVGSETFDVLLDQSGALRVRVDASSSREVHILARLAGSSDWQQVYSYPIAERDEKGMTFVGFGDDPNAVYVLTRNGGDHMMAYPFDLKTHQLGQPLVNSGNFDVSGYFEEPNTNRVVGVDVETLEGNKVQWLDPHWQKVFADLEATFEGEQIRVTSATQDLKKLTVYVNGAGDPTGNYYLVDLSIPEADKIGSVYPHIGAADVAPLRMISYSARDGLQIPAYLTLPPGSSGKNLPLVLLPHGGPQSRDYPGFDWLSQFVATRGYAVLQPEFRGSAGFGRAFTDAGHGQWGLAMQNDISDGVKFLVDQGIADRNKVAIFGWSYGGYAAMAGMTLTPELYKCGVAVAGISNLVTMTGYARKFEGQSFNTDFSYWAKMVGDLTRDGERMRATSPVFHVDKVVAPLLLVHGKDDTTVPFGQSQEMADALTKAGKPFQFVKIDGDDHQLEHVASRTALLQAVEPFLATCLK